MFGSLKKQFSNLTFILCAVSALPFLEFILLRWWLKAELNLRVGWFSMTDYEFIVPVPVALLVLFWALNYGEKLSLRFQYRYGSLHLLSLALLVWFSCSLSGSPLTSSNRIAWWALAFFTFGTHFFVWIPVAYFARNPNRWAILPSLVIAFAFPIYMEVFPVLWRTFGPLVGEQTCSLLSLTLDNVSCEETARGTLIHHPTFAVIVGQGCAGFDAFFMSFAIFVTAWGILWAAAPVWLGMTLLGLNFFLMHLANIFRMWAIFLVGTVNPVAINLFHMHVGWFLYLTVELAFLAAIPSILSFRRQKRIMATFSAVGLLLMFALAITPAPVRACNEICSASTECSDLANCPICGGSQCVSCRVVDISGGDSSDCATFGSRCTWNSGLGQCQNAVGIPELPALVRLCFFLILALFPLVFRRVDACAVPSRGL